MIKTSSAKSKGRKLQQHVRDTLTEILKPYGAVAEDIKSTSMGASGEDVQLSPFARKLLPISIECKSLASIAAYKWFEQAKSNSKEHQPVLVMKANNKKPLAVIDYTYFLELHTHYLKRDT